MKLIFTSFCLFILSSVEARAATQRIAVLVGNNTGLADELPLVYAEADALKMRKALTELGEFRAEDTHVLLGGNADGLRTLLKRVALATKEPPLVLFYYSGHGSTTGLHLSGTRLPFGELQTLLASMGAKVTLALMDSCGSGAMTRIKGAKPGPAYDIDVLRDPDVEGRIVITSSSEDEVAQESDRLQGSFFTYYWVSGLYGAADSNADGLVSLEEAFRFAHFRTVERTIETHAGVQRPSFAVALAGQSQLILANLSRSTARLEVATPSTGSGQYFVLDAEKQLLLTEISQGEKGRASIQIPPGKYRVRKREKENSRVIDLAVREGETVAINDAQMKVVPFEEPSRKGGSGTLHQPQVSLGLRSSLVQGWDAGIHFGASYRFVMGWFFLEPQFQYVSTFQSFSVQQSEYSLGLGAGVLKTWNRLQLSGGIDLGGVFFETPRQLSAEYGDGNPSKAAPPAKGLISLGFRSALVAQLAYRLSGGFSILGEVAPGVYVFGGGDSTRTAWAVRGSIGALYSF